MRIAVKYIFFVLGLFLIQSKSNAQVKIQDDFITKNDYWFWRFDGNQSIPEVKDGFLHLNLNNAKDSIYCNTEIYDPSEPYLPGTQARIRLKNSEMHNGSRGWGFWDGDLDSSLLFDFDVAWIMQQNSPNTDPNFNWLLFGVDGNSLTNRQTHNLMNVIDETIWHTYKIIWEENSVSLFVDDNFVYETTNHLPDEGMRMDIWIDNRVFSLDNPLDYRHYNAENSEMFVDFVEITGTDGAEIKREITKNIIFWKSPNSYPNGETNSLWKEFNFTTETDGEALFFLTGTAESYADIFDDDDLKIVIDNIDYGWDTEYSFDGDKIEGKGKSVIIPVQLKSGEHKLEIYSDVTPFLKDVIIASAENSEMIFKRDYNEIAKKNDGIWKTIEVNSNGSDPVTFILSGTANENEGIRIEIDNIDYGWSGENSFDGNELRGKPNTIIISEYLEPGPHNLVIHNKGNPELYSVAIYGNSMVTSVDNMIKSSEELKIKVTPNPFNITTNIFYQTVSASNNRVSILNILGQNVTTLLDEYQIKGEHKITWNASGIPSGIYFCILESDKYFRVEKLLLLK